jgi:superfamily II DNA helicase RecQ
MALMTWILSRLDTTVMPTLILQKLKQFLHNPDASFKSLEQAHAVARIMSREEDLLAVLPTGGGKSLLFMLPAFVEEITVTVVVLPLVSLTKDMQRRCTLGGMTWTTWKGKSNRLKISFVRQSVAIGRYAVARTY